MLLKAILLSVAALLLVGGGVAFYYASQEPGPLVTIHRPTAVGGASVALDASVDALGSRLTRLDIRLEQRGRSYSLFSLSAPGDARFAQETAERMRITRDVPASSLKGLQDGSAQLVVTAVRAVLYGLRSADTTTAREVKVRVTPPAISVVSTRHYVTLGGAETVVYRAAPPDAESGVQVGDRYYPGYPASGVGGGQTIDPTLRIAFFALLFDQDINTPLRLVARDEAGNTTALDFDHKTFPGEFARSRVPVTEAFLDRVVPAILKATPELELPSATSDERLSAFLSINGDLRARNAAQIEGVARESSPEMLWRGRFRRLRQTSSEAVFADHRTYVYGDREVDEQVHLGIDLASTREAVVTAANAGRVMFSGYLGIYGNCVIIDHGMGVQSLYAHLSVADVETDDRVEANEAIGHSGRTGLAAGDHVHFTMLVAGRPVNPVEWWDPHWIEDRIERKLREAGITPAAPVRQPPSAATPGKGKKPAAPRAAPKPRAKTRTPAKKPQRR